MNAVLDAPPPPYDEYSGSHGRMVALADRIRELMLVEVADEELCALEEKHTHIQPDGSRLISLPAPFNDSSRCEYWDAQVCGTSILSDLGRVVISGVASD